MPTKTLTKNQLVAKLADDAGADKKTTEAVINALTSHVHAVVKKGGVVKLADLGQFKMVKRKARMGRNPQTGAAIKIPAKTAAKFYVAKALRELGRK